MARRKSRNLVGPDGSDEFSTQPLNLSTPRDAAMFRTMTALSRGDSVRPWQWYNKIGEIHYGVTRNAKIAGYAKLMAVKRNPDGTPGDEIKGGIQQDIMSMLYSPYGGTRGFVERFFTHMKVPGDTYLARCRENPDGTGEMIGYDWVSTDEIEKQSVGDTGLGTNRETVFGADQDINRLVLPGGRGGDGAALKIQIKAKDFIGRVWRPSGQYVFMPDSPMRSLDINCELLHLLTLNIRSKLLSRFALNGIFFLPNNITQVRSGAPEGKANEKFHDNKMLDRLIAAMTYAVLNHESPEASIPIFMTGEPSAGEMIKHIVNDRDIMETDMKLRAEMIDRILMGLDSTPQGVKGNEDSNHFSAWAASDEERRVNVAPDIEMMCWALTRLVLWREMKEKDQKDGKIAGSMIWYDLSAAAAKTNLAEDSRQLRDRILIGDPATRRMSGVPETDAPTEAEIARMIGLKQGNPYLAVWGLPISGREETTIDWEMVERFSNGGKTGPDEASPGADPKAGPGVGDPGSPNPKDSKSDTPKRLRPAG